MGNVLRMNENNSLNLINGTDACKGIITRQRITKTRKVEAVLDVFIVCEKLKPFVKEMVIDNERRFPLTTKTNKNSDHFTIHLDLEVSFKPQTEPRKEFFNFRNLQCQKVFKEKTDNNEKLRICFQTDESLEKQSNKFLTTLNNIFHECFKKIRVNNKIRTTEETRLMDEKQKLINEQKKQNDDTGEIQMSNGPRIA